MFSAHCTWCRCAEVNLFRFRFLYLFSLRLLCFHFVFVMFWLNQIMYHIHVFKCSFSAHKQQPLCVSILLWLWLLWFPNFSARILYACETVDEAYSHAMFFHFRVRLRLMTTYCYNGYFTVVRCICALMCVPVLHTQKVRNECTFRV